jgi:PTH1 family peptidyl-tRNA hydrolase
LIVIYDDIDLAPGKLRIRPKGSAGGHNGIKNIISHLGTQTFPRIRVGVGEKPKGWDLADYVLSKFAPEEEPVIRDALARVVEACKVILDEDVTAAMNRFNNK